MSDPKRVLQWIRTGGPASATEDAILPSLQFKDDIRREIQALYYNTQEERHSRSYHHHHTSLHRSCELPAANAKPASINRSTLYTRFVNRSSGTNSWIATPKCDGLRSLLYINASTSEAYVCCSEDFEIACVYKPEYLLGESYKGGGFSVSCASGSFRRTKVVLLVGEVVWAMENNHTDTRPVFVAHDIAATSFQRGMMFTVPFQQRVRSLHSVFESMRTEHPTCAFGDFSSSSSSMINPCGIHVCTKPFWYSASDVPENWWMTPHDDPTPKIQLSCKTGHIPTDGIIFVLRDSREEKHETGKRKKKKKKSQPHILKWKPSSMSTTDAMVWISDLLIAHQKAKSVRDHREWTPPVPFFVRASVLGSGTAGVIPAGRPLLRGHARSNARSDARSDRYRGAQSGKKYLCAPGASCDRHNLAPGQWMHRVGSGSARYAGYVYGGCIRLPLAADLPHLAFQHGIPIWSGLCVEVNYDAKISSGWIFRNVRLDRQVPNTHMSLLSSVIAPAEQISSAEVFEAVFGERRIKNSEQAGLSQQPYDPEHSNAGYDTPPRSQGTPEYIPTSPDYFPAASDEDDAQMDLDTTTTQATKTSNDEGVDGKDGAPSPLQGRQHTKEEKHREITRSPENSADNEYGEPQDNKRVYLGGIQPERKRKRKRSQSESDEDPAAGSESQSSISEGMLDEILKHTAEGDRVPSIQTIGAASAPATRADATDAAAGTARSSPPPPITSPPKQKRRCSARLKAKSKCST